MNRVQPVPNPAYSVSPLTTVGGSIVSRRRVKIPVTNPSTFVGLRNVSAGPTSLYADLADNESFLDTSRLFMCVDLTLNAPIDTLTTCFDQSTQAIIASLEIGSAQGVKFEQIQAYNLLANINQQLMQPPMVKETSEFDFSDYDKSNDKHYGLDKFKDGALTFIGHAYLKPGITQRIHLRFLHSSFLNNIRMIPLFLFRNGLRFTVQFESALKAFNLPVGSSAPPLVEELRFTPEISNFIGPGINIFDATNTLRNFGADATQVTPPVGAQQSQSGVFPVRTVNTLFSNFTGVYLPVPSYNTLWLNMQIYKRVIFPLVSPDVQVVTGHTTFVCIPITIYEDHSSSPRDTTRGPQIIVSNDANVSARERRIAWSGFIAVNPASVVNIVDGEVNAIPRTVSTFSNQQVAAPQSTGAMGPNASFLTFSEQVSGTGSILTGTTTFQIQGTTAGAVGVGQQRAVGFPMYSFNDQQGVPFMSFPQTGSGAVDLTATINNQFAQNLTVAYHVNDAFVVRQYVAGFSYTAVMAVAGPTWQQVPTTPTQQFVRAARLPSAASSAVSLWSFTDSQRRTFGYQCTNAEMLLDLVKPSGEDMGRFQQAFESPTGIPYKFSRLIYRKNTYERASGTQQISIPISPRSLTGLVIAIQDTLMDTESSDTLSALLTNNLSSFQRRGLTRAEVVVGGQVYPVYPLNLKPDGSAYNVAHMTEIENLLGGTIDGSVQRVHCDRVRNYLASGWLDYTSSTAPALFQTSNNGSTRMKMVDASFFVLGWSLAKSDNMPFTTGIDASQSGSIQLNLYFQGGSGGDGDPSLQITSAGRRFDVHLWARCDAIMTLQQNANLIRY